MSKHATKPGRAAHAKALKLFDRYVATQGQASPRNELRMLARAAFRTDARGKAARCFLFWLDGEIPPDGLSEYGGGELINLNDRQQAAALTVLKWWMTVARNSDPLVNVLEQIRTRFEQSKKM